MRENIKQPRERLVATIFNQAKPILPEPYDSMRNNLLIVDSLTAKGHPSAYARLDLKGKGIDQGEYDVFNTLSRDNTLLEVERSPGDPIRVMDKLYPHGKLELMLMQASKKQKMNICDLIQREFLACKGEGESRVPHLLMF